MYMARAMWIGLFLIVLAGSVRRSAAVIPGGVYGADESITLNVDSKQWPHRLGYHLVRGTAVYHGRKIPFLTGVFLPPAFFRTTEAMPILVALHNKSAIGDYGGGDLGREGMGRLLAHGGDDDRAQGERAENPVALRQDAQFIGLVPMCPGGFGWESPPVARLICSMIDRAVSVYHADGDRVYLTGFSYGASSTWRVAMLAPDRFAAIIVCDGRATPDPVHDVQKLKNVAIYLEVGQWDGDFVIATDQMHQALNALPHRNFIFRTISGGNHFCYEAVYDDPEVWKWVLAQRRGALGNSKDETRSFE
jgi:pimeloyl-ACP methyl ester carboxylesterase